LEIRRYLGRVRELMSDKKELAKTKTKKTYSKEEMWRRGSKAHEAEFEREWCDASRESRATGVGPSKKHVLDLPNGLPPCEAGTKAMVGRDP